MTQEESMSYRNALPYDAMGDFSVFREEVHKDNPSDQEKVQQKK